MKRYLFFQTPNSEFEIETPQFAFCGSPRIVALSPNSNASTFFWEQITPDPLTFPVTIFPNNTSKNVTISIPVSTPSPITLRVTLNGIIQKSIVINTKLEDSVINSTKGNVNRFKFNNTLNDPLPFTLVPYPPLGPQVVKVIDGNQTSIKLGNQSYRLNYIKSVNLRDPITNISSVVNTDILKFPYTTLDSRLYFYLNKNYKLFKNWAKQEVFSSDLTEIDFNVIINTPIYIGDDYNYFTSKGNISTFNIIRNPFTIQTQALNDTDFNRKFVTKGNITTFNIVRQTFTVQTQALNDTDFNKKVITKGTINRMIITRTPFTSNVVGG